MNRHLSQLIEISRLDKEIDSFEPRIKQAKLKLDELLEKKAELVLQKEKISDEIKNEGLKILKNEAHIKELSHKLDDVAKKSGSVKTEKEAKALQLEEEIAKEQISAANSEIERAGKAKELKDTQAKEITEKIKELDAQMSDIQKDAAIEVQKIEDERKRIFELKDKLVSEMDQKVIGFYEKIRRWAGNQTVVTIYKQACGGCYMKLNDKIYGDVIRGEEIVTCPHCGRILSLEKEDVEP